MKAGLLCLTILIVTQMTACSSIRRTGLGIASPMFVDALPVMEKEGIWERFRTGTIPNLKLAEGLLATDPENEDLLVSSIKGYAGYGYGVYETQYMFDKYAEVENSQNRILAINTYLKSFHYGLKLLELNDINFDDLKKRINNTKSMKDYLEDNLSNDALTREGVLFSAQSLASLINLQRDDMVLVSYLPIPKALFDWVCQKDPGIAYGTCAIFYGSYEAGRPAMLGGNPSKGKEIFEKALAQYPHNWLVRIAYLENYIVPMMDEDLYAREKKIMKNYAKLLQKELIRFPEVKPDDHFENPYLKVYQAIAIKRFEAIVKNEENIF
jgi:hypothetical protein